MADIQSINGSDQIRNTPDKHNNNNDELAKRIGNTTTGHDHDGVDSKTVDHVNLTNKGTNTHSQIDTAITASANHIADSVSHVTSQDKTNWNGVKTEVDNAKNSTALGQTFETLDALLEYMASQAAPSAHGGLTGRDNEATSADSDDHTHLAQSLWDETESQNVQDTLDDKLTAADLGTAVNNLTAGSVDGDIIETGSDTAKGTLKLGATGGAATFEHTHEQSDSTVESSHYHPNFGDPTPTTLYLNDRISAINAGAQVRNECLNGTFTFAGYDGTNNTHTLGQAVANASHKTGIPGWHVDASSHADFVAQVKTANIGTPPWTDFEASTLRHRGRHGNAVLEFHAPDWTVTQTNTVYSDVMCVDSDKIYTIMYWYRNSTATTASSNYFWVEYWDGNQWQYTNVTGFINMAGGYGRNNDTNWHQKIHTGQFTTGVGRQFVRLVFTISGSASASTQDLQIARVGVFEGLWESAEHIMPEVWFSPHIDYHSSIKVSTSSNIPVTPSETWVEWQAYKKTYYTSLPVTSSFTGTLALPLPKFNYIYNVKVSPSYRITNTIPTTPVPTTVYTWYDYWQQTNGQNFNGSTAAINVYFPAPASGTEYVTIEVDYWPADIADAELP